MPAEARILDFGNHATAAQIDRGVEPTAGRWFPETSAPAAPPRPCLQAWRAPAAGTSLQPKPRVLVVDDFKAVHRLIQAWIGSWCDLTCVSCGADGVEAATGGAFDLILLDVDMPRMNGFECCQQLRQMPSLRHTPIVFLTSDSSTQSKVRGLELGGNDYILKPFHPNEFEARVRSMLRLRDQIQDAEGRAQIDPITRRAAA
ncbi:MAG: response regulator transcription factor [Planctomycetota bacterium]